MTCDPAIKANDLSKRYGDITAVNNLCLSIEPGTVYGLLGPNGAGKTTTMRLLTTLLEPTAGTGAICGHRLTDKDDVRKSIGYLPDKPPLYEELTAREQLRFFAYLRDMQPSNAADRINQLINQFDLDTPDKRISTYSKGMRQKVGLIYALLHQPSVLFLDEPTSGLDPRTARQVRETIRILSNEDRTVFLSTHLLPAVDELADIVGVLNNGRLIAEAPPSELTKRVDDGENPTLEDTFLELTK